MDANTGGMYNTWKSGGDCSYRFYLFEVVKYQWGPDRTMEEQQESIHFFQKMHHFTTANIVVKLGMTLLRKNPPLLLLKKTDPELTKQKLGEGENSATQHTSPWCYNCSCGRGKGGRNSCIRMTIRGMLWYTITVCNCIIMLPGESSALQKLLSMFASYPPSRQQSPWPKGKAEDCFSKEGGQGGGES